MQCVRSSLPRWIFTLAASAAFLTTPVQAEPTIGPVSAKPSATEAVVVDGKIVLKAAARKRAGDDDNDQQSPAEQVREWLVESKSGADHPYPPRPLPTNLLMCRPAQGSSM